jgi:hypothetical protein
MRSLTVTCIIIAVLSFSSIAIGQEGKGIDPEALIEQILIVENNQYQKITDIVFDAEMLLGKDDKKKGFQEEERFIKKVYMKNLPDTVLYAEEYLEYYEKGEKKDQKKCEEKGQEQIEKSKKRKSKNISTPMLRPFYPEQREFYKITYNGVSDEKIDDHFCHHFTVKAHVENEDFINGDYYFEAESFNLVRVDFVPSKLAGGLMFKMKNLKMSVRYGPTSEGYWFPRQFDITGKGKAAFFIGVNFAGVEYFRNPQINTGLSDEIFEEKENE